jgi:hypothetical protein
MTVDYFIGGYFVVFVILAFTSLAVKGLYRIFRGLK